MKQTLTMIMHLFWNSLVLSLAWSNKINLQVCHQDLIVSKPIPRFWTQVKKGREMSMKRFPPSKRMQTGVQGWLCNHLLGHWLDGKLKSSLRLCYGPFPLPRHSFVWPTVPRLCNHSLWARGISIPPFSHTFSTPTTWCMESSVLQVFWTSFKSHLLTQDDSIQN